jgi:hypothetical protein
MAVVKTGPQGGKYYVKNGRKVYVHRSTRAGKKSASRSSKHKSSKRKSSKRKLKSGKKRGCSNAGKYKGVPKNLFCGPAGGACPGTFPCDSPQRCRSALSYSRNAPNPDGIRRCVRRISKRKGWSNPKTGKLKMSKSSKRKTQRKKSTKR